MTMRSQLCHVLRVVMPLAITTLVLIGTAWAEEGGTKAKKWEPDGVPVRDPEHIFSKRVKNYKELKRQNIVMQKRDYSCGAAA